MSRVADPKSKIALLRAAEDVFAERGVAGAKVEDIARGAGLSKGAFYLHFESKEAALKQIVEAWLARCASLFGAPHEYPDALPDPDALVDFCIERDVRIYEFLWQTRLTMRIILSCQGEYAYLCDAFRDEMKRRNREWLDLWKQDGLIRPDAEIEVAVLLISGAYEELSNTMIKAEQRPPFERWLELAQEMVVRAFGTSEFIAALDRRNRRAKPSIIELRHGAVRDGTHGTTAGFSPKSPSSSPRLRVKEKG